MTDTLAQAARHTWRTLGGWRYVSFPTIGRAYRALAKLAELGRACEYDGRHDATGRHWIRLRTG